MGIKFHKYDIDIPAQPRCGMYHYVLSLQEVGYHIQKKERGRGQSKVRVHVTAPVIEGTRLFI